MLIIGLYVLGVAVVVALLFALVWFVFGRGEDLPPVDGQTTLTRLPRAGIGGDDVRRLVFAQSFRGYKAVEVDWALEKLAREIDELRGVVLDLQERDVADTGEMPTVRGRSRGVDDR
ncbi:DivIVA domain-containing protein [Gordonia zhaorongruii]|uniref:DivIVA domain-containing protein n=1 Tax=Gordonia zhaorongruii TaxID=2597659 RepID=UPI0010500DD2|nr:DivIVA domain-containing protein [Gordonia zhaorongruii]